MYFYASQHPNNPALKILLPIKKCVKWFNSRTFNQIYIFLTLSNLLFTGYVFLHNERPKPKFELNFSLDNAIYISQNWGRIQFFQNIQVTNIGNAFGTIDSLNINIESLDKNDKFKLSATAVQRVDAGHYYRFFPINLRPTGWEGAMYAFYEEFSDTTYDHISQLLDTIDSEKKSTQTNYQISRKTHDYIANYINAQINNFKKGRYIYLVSETSNDEYTMYSCSTFVLSETNVLQLHNLTKTITDPFSSNKNNSIYIHLQPASIKATSYMVKKYLNLRP